MLQSQGTISPKLYSLKFLWLVSLYEKKFFFDYLHYAWNCARIVFFVPGHWQQFLKLKKILFVCVLGCIETSQWLTSLNLGSHSHKIFSFLVAAEMITMAA